MKARAKIILFFWFVATLALAPVLYFQGQSRAEDPTVLFQTVDGQLKAFREKNFQVAYALASSGFRSQWTLEEFTYMARGDFHRILGAERIEFGPWQRRGRYAVLQVFFVNADGTVAPCIYSLVSEGARWKIDSARWVRGWPSGQRMRGIRA